MTYQSPQGLASLGRNGDSMLVHMSPSEVAGLQGLAMSQGGSLSINPQTGLPEAFKLGGFFKSLLPTLVGAGFGFTAAPLWAGIAAGAATGAVTNRENPLMGAALGGLGGYGGMGIGSALKNTMAIVNPATTAPAVTQSAVSGIGPGALGTTGEIGGANLIGSGIAGGTAGTNAAATNIMGAMKNAGVNIADPLAQDATRQALQTIPKTSNFSGVNMDPSSSFLKPTVFDQAYGASTIQPSGTMGGSTLIGEGRNLANSAASAQNPLIAASMSNSPTPGFMDTFVDQLGGSSAAMKKLGLPVGGAVLGGLEPSDLYGEPIKPKENIYDPYATLNLGGSSGLRLVAEGGYIDGYATGGTIQSGGIRDLYGTPDNQPTISPGLSGFGLGRLNNLAGEQAMTQAQTLGYAMGGPISFADGGDTDMETLGLPTLSSNVSNIKGDINNLLPSIIRASLPLKNMQGSATTTQDGTTEEPSGSLITKVAANLKEDPNYKPANALEESIVNQLRDSNNIAKTQGLGSLVPSTPTAPSFNVSTAMTPTYYAGMNAPRGYADGGNVNTSETDKPNPEGVVSLYKTVVDDKGVSSRERVPYQYSKIITPGVADFYDISPIQYAANVYPGAILPKFKKEQMAKGGYLNGAGDGMSDSIPATIEGKQPARLADGEFVIPADVVSHIGNGSSKAGSKRLYAMMDRVRKARTGHTKQGKQIKPEKYMPV